MATQLNSQSPIYSTFASDEMMSELVELFVSEIPDRVKTLETAYATPDSELLRRTAHQLKGAFGSYGFDALTAPARQLEHSLETNAEWDEVRQHLDYLISLCGQMTADPEPS